MRGPTGMQQRVNSTPPNGESAAGKHRNASGSPFRRASFTWYPFPGQDECRTGA